MMANTPVAVTPRSEKFPALQYLKTRQTSQSIPQGLETRSRQKSFAAALREKYRF
jgi:hypothetical protein